MATRRPSSTRLLVPAKSGPTQVRSLLKSSRESGWAKSMPARGSPGASEAGGGVGEGPSVGVSGIVGDGGRTAVALGGGVRGRPAGMGGGGGGGGGAGGGGPPAERLQAAGRSARVAARRERASRFMVGRGCARRPGRRKWR